MEQVKATRSELMFRRQQIELAQQALSLLKRKRDALLRELLPIIDKTMKMSLRLEMAMVEAQTSLALAKAIDGEKAVRSVSFTTKDDVVVDISGSTVMGVPVPTITKAGSTTKGHMERGYSITGVSARIDKAANSFEEIVDIIIENADVETRLKRLGQELEKTNRRANALENVIIPNLKEQVRFIRMALDERAREDHYRLKKVKQKMM